VMLAPTLTGSFAASIAPSSANLGRPGAPSTVAGLVGAALAGGGFWGGGEGGGLRTVAVRRGRDLGRLLMIGSPERPSWRSSSPGPGLDS
jgi:hypothetical protein